MIKHDENNIKQLEAQVKEVSRILSKLYVDRASLSTRLHHTGVLHLLKRRRLRKELGYVLVTIGKYQSILGQTIDKIRMNAQL